MRLFLEPYLISFAVLLLLSVVASKLSDRFGIPALLVFLGIGMLAGSEGLGGIYFDDSSLAQYIGVIALAIILFSGGLDTQFSSIRPVLVSGLLLSTLGVAVTAGVVGVIAHYALHVSWLEGLLLGAIVSSTDAAAVFSILRASGVALKGRLRPLLELESGSNDPMAVFLTISLLMLITRPETTPVSLVFMFVQQVVVGSLVAVIVARVGLFLINRLRLGYQGLYPVLALGLIFLAYAAANLAGGSGFLAVYLTGIGFGQQDFLHKRSLIRFFDGFAWLMQIILFLTLGLLVFPSRMIPLIAPGMLLALALILIARPISVFISLLPTRFRLSEKAFISWVGLRGAAPIVLATFPYIAGLPSADLLFNVVFFVVLTSVLLQGTTIAFTARRLGVDDKEVDQRVAPLELVSPQGVKGEMREVTLPADSPVIGKAIFELGLPDDYLIVLIGRGAEYLIPNGGLVLQPGDHLLALTSPAAHEKVLLQVKGD